MNNNSTDNSNKVYKVDYSRTFLNQEIYNREQEENSTSKIKRTVVISVLIFLVILLGIVIFVDSEELSSKLFGEESKISRAFSNEKKQHANFPTPFGMKRQNILLLGVDDNPEAKKDMWAGTRTDTIILANIDPKSKSINAISIPRDSKVFLARNNGINKINSAHAIGGVEMTKETIEKTLGVKIHRYVLVHEDIVKELVDVLGGVDIYIEKPMHYRDRTAHLNINFDKGLQKLDGQKAIEYLRFRHDALGDIGRTQRQQWFMKSLFERLHSPQVITKIPEVLNVINNYIKTDMSFYELSQYAAMARSIDENKIEIATLPGSPNKRGYISYWILDPVKTQEMINRMIYRIKPQVSSSKFKAGIMYSPKREDDAIALKEKLNDLGFEVNMLKITHLSHTKFVANKSNVTIDFFNWIQKKVPEFQNVQFIYDPTETFSVGSDFTMVLAEQ